jgi:tetratricopeptide (TPR) repeat protein/transglutaminase-like putative cysteine protease
MKTSAMVLAAAFAAGAAHAADQPKYAPPAAWIKPAPIPDLPPATDGSALQILLEDAQTRLGSDANQGYVEVAVRVLTPTGLAALANLTQIWNPDTDTLIFHKLNIVRGGKTIDLLDGGKKVTVLRRETNLQMAMLDGALTATVQPEGLQVGDIVDEAITIEHRDPVLQGHSESVAAMRFVGTAGRYRVRETWPETVPIRWRTTEGLPAAKLTTTAGISELLIDQTNAVAPKPPADAPQRFTDVGELDVSDFKDWAAVSALAAPLYAKAAALKPDSPLKAEADKIRKASSDPTARVEAALRLVEDQVHYVFLGMNFGGYVPADADVTWSRRFGDCKGKTVLLLALLHELGVEAQPALVSTVAGDGLDHMLPHFDMFDHVIVRATVGGKVYWLDGTRVGDRRLDDIPIPDFRWVLPVQDAGAALVRIGPPPYPRPAYEITTRLDATAGYDAPAPAHVEQLFRGDDALAWHLSLDAVGRADAERALREHWRSRMSWIEPKTVDYAYDDMAHTMRLTMDGSASMHWLDNYGARDFDIGDSNLGFNAAFKREPGPQADAPFTVSYPDYSQWTTIITLPDKGAGFRLLNAEDVDETIAQRRYRRSTRIADGVVTMVATESSLAPEFPASEADAARTRLRNLTATDVIVRGPGAGLARTDTLPDQQLTSAPTGAAGYIARGAAFLNRKDFDHAIEDFSAAIKLAPNQAKAYYDRGVAQFEAGRTEAASADFDKALALDPTDRRVLMARGEVRLGRGDDAGAERDFDQALKASPNDVDMLEQRAKAYERNARYEQAVRALDRLITLVADKNKLLGLLNDRCWAKGEWGHELEGGLADCDAALALSPGLPAILDSRGFVHLRLKQYDAAIADYGAALAQRPNLASSLYGRSLANAAKGNAAAATADASAASKIAPDLAAQFARLGFVAAVGAQSKVEARSGSNSP